MLQTNVLRSFKMCGVEYWVIYIYMYNWNFIVSSTFHNLKLLLTNYLTRHENEPKLINNINSDINCQSNNDNGPWTSPIARYRYKLKKSHLCKTDPQSNWRLSKLIFYDGCQGSVCFFGDISWNEFIFVIRDFVTFYKYS